MIQIQFFFYFIHYLNMHFIAKNNDTYDEKLLTNLGFIEMNDNLGQSRINRV
jgi:hypothetical protein